MIGAWSSFVPTFLILLVNVPGIIAALRYQDECALWNFLKYKDTYSALCMCSDIGVGSLSLSIMMDSIELDDCIAAADKAICDQVLTEFVSSSSSADLVELAQLLLDSPANTCSCLNEYEPNLDSCIQSVDAMTNYCDTFYPDAKPANDPNAECYANIVTYCFPSSLSGENSLKGDSSYPLMINETISCFEQTVPIMEHRCVEKLTEQLVTALLGCSSDILLYCSSVDILEPSVKTGIDASICLTEHYSGLSDTCKTSINTLEDEVIPCLLETKTYCPEAKNVTSSLECLVHAAEHGDGGPIGISPTCSSVLDVYKKCETRGNNNENNNNNNNNKMTICSHKPPPPPPPHGPTKPPIITVDDDAAIRVGTGDADTESSPKEDNAPPLKPFIIFVSIILLPLLLFTMYKKNSKSFSFLMSPTQTHSILSEICSDCYSVLCPSVGDETSQDPEGMEMSNKAKVQPYGLGIAPMNRQLGSGSLLYRPLDESERGYTPPSSNDTPSESVSSEA